MAIAVVDPAGTLVYFEKADTTQNGSANVAIGKARSAALYKRPTKAFQVRARERRRRRPAFSRSKAQYPSKEAALLVDGKLVGAVGVSGDLSEHDGQCAAVGAAVLAAPALVEPHGAATPYGRGCPTGICKPQPAEIRTGAGEEDGSAEGLAQNAGPDRQHA